jgi:glycosyltransferase involved in cell wall biosynthesis
MHALPKISLVTPSYNQAEFIERTIRSVIGQEYPALEYIIVDGASSDGSVDIIKRYAAHLTYWISEPDGGQSEGINKGLSRSTGEIIGWLNSDDTLAPRALDRMAKVYAAQPEADLVYGHTCIIDSNDRVIKRLVAVPTTPHELIRYNRNIWSQPGTTWRRRLQDKIGLLDEGLHYTMDCDFWMRAALGGNIYCTPYHLGNLRNHSSAKGSRFVNLFNREQLILDGRYGAEYRDHLHRLMFKSRRILRTLDSPSSVAFYFGYR